MLYTLIVASVLAAGPGASFSGGRVPVPESMQGVFGASAIVGEPTATYTALLDGTLDSIHGDSLTAGTNGGGSTFTLAVTSGGSAVCSGSVACTVVGAFSFTCSSATFSTGDDLHLEVTASDCASLPVFLARAEWFW